MSSEASVKSAEWKATPEMWLCIFATMLTTFMVVLDSSIANVALPNIAGSFSATQDESVWILTSYLVANGVILPSTAWFSDVFGRKNFLIICTIIFTVASLLCGVSTSMTGLIVARVIQGLGGGAILPITQAILLETFPAEKRGFGMSIYGFGIIFAPVIGPTLGGWITDTYSWHWIFLINLPVGIVATILTKMYVHDPDYAKKKEGMVKIDYLGFGLLIVWLFTLQIILDNGQKSDWFEAQWVRDTFTIMWLSFLGFIWWELKNKKPLLNLRIFLDRNFAIGCVMATCIGGILYSTLAILPLFMQHLLGYTATLSGLAISPRGFGSFAALVICGTLSGKVDDRILISIGFLLLAISCFMFGNLNLNIAMGNVIWPNILCGVAITMVMIPLSTITFNTLKNSEMTNGTGIFSLARSVGGAVGVSLVSTIISRRAQIHQAYLVQHLSDGNHVFTERLAALKALFSVHVGQAVGEIQAGALLYKQLLQQSNLLAFMDCFKIFGLVALVLIPCVYTFKKVKKKQSSGDVGALH